MDKNREKIYQQLMWDYNIPPEDIDKLRMPDLRKKYKYVKNRLQKIVLDTK